MELRDRTVLITGAASGIGRATADVCAARGARLVLTDVAADGLAATAAALGPAVVHAAPADLTDHGAVEALADDVHAALGGPVDVVMNVAGIAIWGGVETLSHAQWRRVIEVNLMGPISVIECFVAPMIDAGRGGHLVNVSSAAGLFGLPWHAPYSASKFGLRGVSEVLRFDLRRHGIGVTLVCPGGVDTPIVRAVEVAGVDTASPAFQRAIGRFRAHAQTPEHVARCIVRGVERERYLVFTSPDIALGHLAQRYFPPGYALAMRALNAGFAQVVRRARPDAAPRA